MKIKKELNKIKSYFNKQKDKIREKFFTQYNELKSKRAHELELLFKRFTNKNKSLNNKLKSELLSFNQDKHKVIDINNDLSTGSLTKSAFIINKANK